MSHDLDHSTGKPAMAYVGDHPWHNLGERLIPGASIEKWVEAACLDWTIEMLPVNYQMGGTNLVMPDRFVLARSDTQAALSVVSPDYLVVQPKEVLEFYRDLMDDRHYQIETAGALNGGRKVWALAKTGLVANIAIDPADKLGAYVLLATSCDKTLATTVTFTSVRVVCQNTLSFAAWDMKNNRRRHTKIEHGRRFDAQAVKHDLGLLDRSWDKFIAQIRPFSLQGLSVSEAKTFFTELVQSEQEKRAGKLSTQKQNEVDKLIALYKSAPGQQLRSSKMTLWGAVCAVTYYVDHVKRTRGERLDNAWFGTGANLKQKAWELAVAYSMSK